MDLNILMLSSFPILKRRVLGLFSLMKISLKLYFQLRLLLIFTPRYLTLSVGYSLLPYNFVFKSPSDFFCLDQGIQTG